MPSFGNLDGREQLSTTERNKRIVELIDLVCNEEKANRHLTSMNRRLASLTDEGNLISDIANQLSIGEAHSKLGSFYLGVEELKNIIREAHEYLSRFSNYMPVKKAILDNPELEQFGGVELNKVLSLLERKIALEKKAAPRDGLQGYRNDLFSSLN